MASGSGSSGNRGGGGSKGGGSKLKNNTSAMNRRLNNNGFVSMNRGNRVRGQRNATARSDGYYLPF